MKYAHEEIKDILPDYACGGLHEDMKTAVRLHLDACEECRTDLQLLIGVMCIESDDPGDFFWNSLAGKVREEVRRERHTPSFWDRFFPLSAAAAAAVLIVGGFVFTFHPDTQRREMETVYSYRDPLFSSMPDLSGLKEEDIPLFTDDIVRKEAYRPAAEIAGFGYYRDLASLDEKELERLDKALKERRETGG